MKLTAKSQSKFTCSHGKNPNKYANFTGRVNAESLNVREWAGKSNKLCTFSPLKRGDKVHVCDSILSSDKETWYYIHVGQKYGFVNAKYVSEVMPKALKVLSYLNTYNKYIKAHASKFYNNYDSDMTSFSKAKKKVNAGKKVGLTCVVPLRWALHEMGIQNGNGQSLISAPDGSFKKHYTGEVKKYLSRITTGGAIGKTVKQAVDNGLLRDGDIVCYKNITHTSTYSGSGYKFYEGGGQCVKDGHYPDGILLDYSKNYYKDKKIAEILRWKG